MALHNTSSSYGGTAKAFHWLTALLILALIPLGIIASNLGHAIQSSNGAADQAMISRATFLFSLHKTLGVAVFFVALARILWAVGQTKPGLLNGDRRLEAWAAETVHWLLYGSLVAVPLSGWIHHAATTGFAPIRWPFGQSLPFVPQSETIAQTAGTLHYILQWVLIGALVLHIAGALKHHVVDGDATLRRMLPGKTQGHPSTDQPGHAFPLTFAALIWIGVLGGAAGMGWFGSPDSHATPTAARTETQIQAEASPSQSAIGGTGNWQVSEGVLSISVRQMGADVQGRFATWSARIQYDEIPDADGLHGSVNVEVDIASLSLGTVTGQALGADYLAATDHPTAVFTARLFSENDQMIARGTLTIRDVTLDAEIPFSLIVQEDTAIASGELTVDRRDFGIGNGVQDEGSLAFAVGIAFTLTANRAAP